MSRTIYSIKNFSASMIATVLTSLFSFVTRTVFVKTLGAEYLGIDGLFNNILSALSLAELGVGLAIIYNLYKPISENDYDRIILLMKFYKQVYRVIGFVIFVIGICLIPFLPTIIKDYHRLSDLHINAVLIFLLFLFKSASSYWFFAYKTAIVKAHQKNYILDKIRITFIIISNISQIIILILFENFTIYLITMIVFVILQNIACAIKSDKMYPYVKNKTSQKLKASEIKRIFKDCGAIFLYRVNFVVTNATDNLVLSYYLGLRMVGVYSNYTVVLTALRNLLGNFYNSLLSSLGNLHAEGDSEHEYKIFSVVNFITFFMYGIVAIGFAVVINEFITMWLGADFIVTTWEFKGIQIKTPLGLLMAIELYLRGINELMSKFRNSTGVFQQGKYRPIATIIINLAVSVFLVTKIGISGVVIGTIVSALATYIWYDPMIIYRHTFKTSTKEYWIKNLKYAVAVCVAGVISYKLCDVVNGNGIIFVILHGIICVLTSVAVFTAAFFRTEEFKYLSTMVKNLVKRKIK